MSRILLAAGAAVLLVAAVALLTALVGTFLPRRHVVSRSILLDTPPDEVYRTIRDVGSAAAWRTGIDRVEILEPVGGRPRFRETAGRDAVTYQIERDDPPRAFVTRIVNTDLGYSGSWTYDVVQASSGTRVTITETGDVSNVLFRTISALIIGHNRTIDAYLRDLDRHLGARGTAAGAPR